MTMNPIQKEEETNVVEFPNHNLKLLTGGKGPPTDETNWLANIQEGTVFTVRSKVDRSNFMLLTLELVKKASDGSMVLYENFMDRPFGRIIPEVFCRMYDKYGTLQEPTQEKEEEVINGQSDRTITPES